MLKKKQKAKLELALFLTFKNNQLEVIYFYFFSRKVFYVKIRF